MPDLMSFFVFALILNVSPGPDVLLVIRQSLLAGSRHGVAVAFGAASGSLIWGLASVVGLAHVVGSSPVVFAAVQYAGAAYCVILGAWTVAAAQSPTRNRGQVAACGTWSPVEHASTTPSHAFRLGMASDLLNPKVGVFYLALVPQFISVEADVVAWSVTLVAVELAVAVVTMAGYAILAARVRSMITSPSVVRRTEQLLGCALLAVGAKVASG